MKTSSNFSQQAGQPAQVLEEKTMTGTENILPDFAYKIQPKLTVGSVDDPMERNADVIADRVLAMPNNFLLQRKCAECEEEEKLQKKSMPPLIQRRGEGGTTVSSQTDSSIKSALGSGRTIPVPEKSFMESRFGTDFSNVKIHTDTRAAQLSRDLNAQAFTVGNDIFFNQGKFSPETSSGKHLLAHELTHTIQQSGRVQRVPDLFAGTHPVTDAEHGNVEGILNPGATVSSTGAVTLPTPTAACTNGTYATDMRNAIVPAITSRATTFRNTPVTFSLGTISTIADVAQRETELYFNNYLTTVNRRGGDYVRSYNLGSNIRDQATTTQWQTREGRRGWVAYFFDTDGEAIKSANHCDETTNEQVINSIADDPALQTDIDDAVRSWPAEATGGVHLQTRVATPDRSHRWDVFTTLIHEFLHVIAHPNYQEAANQLPDAGGRILREGMADVMRRELWDGAGRLETKVRQPAFDPDRAVIEGGAFTLDTSVITYHSDYDQRTEAESIVREVGRDNAKGAYFLGHVELLGLGQGTNLAPGGSLTSVGLYNSTDDENEEVVDRLSGETYAALLTRTRGTEIRDMHDNVIAPGSALPAQVKVPGVTHVRAIRRDSLWRIGRQHNVTMTQMITANPLPNPELIFPGQRILIPVH